MNHMHDWARRFPLAAADSTVDVLFDEWVQAAGEHYSYPKTANDGQECVPNEPGLYVWGADRTVDGHRRIVPRYVGKDNNSLRSRLLSRKGRWSGGRGRYVLPSNVDPGDTPPQGWLALSFHDEIRDVLGDISNDEYKNTVKPWRVPRDLRANTLHLSTSPAVRGLQAFPPQLVAAFRRKEGGHPKLLRLRHAVDWALHGGPGLVHLWVAFLPGIADLEGELRDAAMAWRKKHGLPPLLNREDRVP